jgi:hypothetical protein
MFWHVLACFGKFLPTPKLPTSSILGTTLPTTHLSNIYDETCRNLVSYRSGDKYWWRCGPPNHEKWRKREKMKVSRMPWTQYECFASSDVVIVMRGHRKLYGCKFVCKMLGELDFWQKSTLSPLDWPMAVKWRIANFR